MGRISGRAGEIKPIFSDLMAGHEKILLSLLRHEWFSPPFGFDLQIVKVINSVLYQVNRILPFLLYAHSNYKVFKKNENLR